MNKNKLQKAYARLQMMHAKTSLKIMEATDGNVSVGEVAAKTKVHYVIVCNTLSKLRKTGVMTSRRNGKCVYYSVNERELGRVMDICVKICNYES